MQPSSKSPENQAYNLNNELAKERTRAAADRTLMAWIRTALSLIGFGFGIPTIVRTIESTRVAEHIDPHRFSTIVGLSFIGVGIFGMAAALKEHRDMMKRLLRDRYTYESSNTAEIVGVALLLIGAISFLGVAIKALNFQN
jgi:putative membrane protein